MDTFIEQQQLSTNIVPWSKSGPKQPWFEFPEPQDTYPMGDSTVKEPCLSLAQSRHF